MINRITTGLLLLLLISPSFAAKGALSGVQSMNVVGSLLLVVLAIIVCAFILKKMSSFQFRQNNNIQLLDGLPLGTREKLLLIQAGDKQLLIGVSQQGINTLHVFDEPIVVEKKGVKHPKAFQNILKQWMTKGTAS